MLGRKHFYYWVAFVAISLVGSMVFLAYAYNAEQQKAHILVHKSATIHARLVSNDLADLDRYIAQAIRFWRDYPQQQEISLALLGQMKASRPELMDLLILNASGDIVVWTGLGDPPAVADRSYYRYHLDNTANHPYLSQRKPSRVHDSDFFALSRGLRNQDGELVAVGVAIISTDALSQHLLSLQDDTYQAGLVHRDGGPCLVMGAKEHLCFSNFYGPDAKSAAGDEKNLVAVALLDNYPAAVVALAPKTHFQQPFLKMAAPVVVIWLLLVVVAYRFVRHNIRLAQKRGKEEAQLVRDNILLKTQQEVSLDGILIVDENDKIISFNQRFCNIWEIPDQVMAEQSSEKAMRYVLPLVVDPDGFVKRILDLYKNKETTSSEEVFLTNGKILARYSAPMLGSGAEYYGRVWFYRDITELKKAEVMVRDFNQKLIEQVEQEVALRMQSEAKYRVLFNAVPDAIFVHGVEEDGTPKRFSEVNDTAAAMFSTPKEKMLELTPMAFSQNRPIEEVRALMTTLQKVGQVEFEEVITTLDGQRHTVLTILRSVCLADERSVVAVLHDLTEIKKLYEERMRDQGILIQQTKLAELGSMIGAIAHQWKQPINAIGLIVQDLRDSYEFDELDEAEIDRVIGQTMDHVQFMAQTIDDFRNFYKPSQHVEPFSPLIACEEVVGLLGAQLLKDGISVFLRGDKNPKVLGRKSEFKQTILNIINNAKEALIENKIVSPAIKIESKEHSGQLILTIEDNGGGIPQELLPDKLFESFTSTKGNQGTGIGLSLGRTIIEEKMGGKLRAYNQNEGACFEMVLGVAQEV